MNQQNKIVIEKVSIWATLVSEAGKIVANLARDIQPVATKFSDDLKSLEEQSKK